MMESLRHRRAQSTLEYALLIAAIVGALLAMRYYVGRAVQGRVRSATDDVGAQYSAGHTTSLFKTTRGQTTTVESFGIDPETEGFAFEDNTDDQGTSYFEITEAGIVARETTDGHDETITWSFNEEETQEGLIP